MTAPSRILRRAVLLPIFAYKRVLSPALPRRCRYHPSCSSYAVQAIGRYGILRGVVLAAWRLLRCNPWSPGGVDELADRRLFRDHQPHDHGGVAA